VSHASGLSFAVRVRPGASRTAVGGRYDGAAGPALVVTVTAPAVDGRATEAALRATAEALGVRRSAIGLRSGETSRDKVFVIEPASPQVAARLETLRDGRA
jgi:uncharacterized protein YggU (UPF0235/DUF167 family)